MEILEHADYTVQEGSMCNCQVVDDDGGCWQTDQGN